MDKCHQITNCEECLQTPRCWFMRRSPADYGECIPQNAADGYYFRWLVDGKLDLEECPPVPSTDDSTQVGAFNAFANSSAPDYALLIALFVLLVFGFFLLVCFLYFCVCQCLFGRANRRSREAGQRRRQQHVPNFLPVDEIRLENIEVIEESSEEEITIHREATPHPMDIQQEREESVVREIRHRRTKRTIRRPLRFGIDEFVPNRP